MMQENQAHQEPVSAEQVCDACRDGHLDLLKHWKQLDLLPSFKSARLWLPQDYAAYNGHTAILKWIVEESGQNIELTFDKCFCAQLAARNGHLETLKWLVYDSGQPVELYWRQDFAFQKAAQNGHSEVVKWFLVEYRQFTNFEDCVQSAVRHASFHGDLDLLDWIFRTQDLTSIPADVLNSCTQEALAAGHLPVAKWFLERPELSIDITINGNAMLRFLASQSHLPFLKWLLRHPKYAAQATAAENVWLLNLTDEHLREVALTCFGLDPDCLSREQLGERLKKEASIPALETLSGMLAASDENMTVEEKRQLFSSRACQQLLKTGLPVTLPQLRQLAAGCQRVSVPSRL